MEYVATLDEWMAKYRDAGSKELYAQQLADGITATLQSREADEVVSANIGFMSFLHNDFVIEITRTGQMYKAQDSRCTHAIVTASNESACLYPNMDAKKYADAVSYAQLQYDISTEPALSGMECSLLPAYTGNTDCSNAAAVVGAAVAAYICDRFWELDFGTHCYDATSTDFTLHERVKC